MKGNVDHISHTKKIYRGICRLTVARGCVIAGAKADVALGTARVGWGSCALRTVWDHVCTLCRRKYQIKITEIDFYVWGGYIYLSKCHWFQWQKNQSGIDHTLDDRPLEASYIPDRNRVHHCILWSKKTGIWRSWQYVLSDLCTVRSDRWFRILSHIGCIQNGYHLARSDTGCNGRIIPCTLQSTGSVYL